MVGEESETDGVPPPVVVDLDQVSDIAVDAFGEITTIVGGASSLFRVEEFSGLGTRLPDPKGFTVNLSGNVFWTENGIAEIKT